MKILEYQFEDVEHPGWKFDRVKFDKINLLVGDTATGKSRLLNTIFNLGRFTVSKEVKEFKNGSWVMVFQHEGITYDWTIRTEKRDDERKPGIVSSETLASTFQGQTQQLIERETSFFRFRGQDTPKLSLQETSISLLREEELIKPVFKAFSIIGRRQFDRDALGTASDLQVLPMSIVETMEKKKDLYALFTAELNVSVNLFI
ncbi:MAG TPA: hypothetical protein VJL88_11765, partial [Nitrospira sp.]|nr:hypothetical protein [Nitrospira sp.]